MAGNASFDGLIAFLSEKQLFSEWYQIWANSWPFLRKLQADGLAGRGETYNPPMEYTPDGNSVLCPLVYSGPATSARAATSANQTTAITPTPTQGFTQMQFNYAKYENAFWLNDHEATLIARQAGGTTRTPILSGKVEQLMTDFKNVASVDLVGTQNGTGYTGNGQPMGQQYPLSTSNSPGGVSQTTYPALAAGTVSTSQQLYEGIIDDEIDRIGELGHAAGPADFLQLSYASGNNIYGKMYGLIAPNQTIIDQAKSVEYGFEVFKYRSLDCWRDGRLGTALPGSMVLGASKSWFCCEKSKVPERVTRNGTMRLPGTSTMEFFYTWWIMLGIRDPASNTLYTNLR